MPSRRELFYTLAGAALATAPPAASAAVPSYKDDYAPPAPRKAPAASSAPPAYGAQVLPKNLDVPRLRTELSYLSTSVSQGSWDAVRGYIKNPGSYVHLLKVRPQVTK